MMNSLRRLVHISPNYLCRPKYPVRNFWSPKKCVEGVKNLEREGSFCPDESDMLPESWSQPKVVIIGAGIAGLSAAHRLVQNGIYDINILEALDRPGGRIHSSWFHNSIAELGATEIKGACVANSVYNLAVKECLVKSPVMRKYSSKTQFYTNHGKPIHSSVSEAAIAIFREIEEKAVMAFESDNSSETLPNIETFMLQEIMGHVMTFSELEKRDALMVMHACLTSLKEKTGASLDSVNAKFYGSLPSLPGGNVIVPGGFVGTLAPLIREIPDGCIKYCKPVETIRWDVNEADKQRACVQCVDEEYFPADYVIITTPLGFLKDNAHNLFSPNLPAYKMDAIRTLGFGHMNNLFLYFPHPLWLKDDGDLMFAWDPEEYKGVDSWIKGLTSLKVDDSNNQVYSGVVAGKEAALMETLNGEQIKDDIQKLLQRFLGNASIPKPSTILRSQWSTDAFTKGAFTYISTDSGLDQIKCLADPIPDPCNSGIPILFFAGEHTSPEKYATVHGARDTGIREADKIINFTKELRGAPSKQ